MFQDLVTLFKISRGINFWELLHSYEKEKKKNGNCYDPIDIRTEYSSL